MQDILDQLRVWAEAGHEIALATVVSTWGSSPRAVGAHMAVRADAAMVGSVSGGCVEGAVVQEALEILAGSPSKLLRFGVSDETAWDVGLACGGSIEVFVQPFNADLLDPLKDSITARLTRCIATVIAGPERMLGALGIFDRERLVAGGWPDELGEESPGWIAAALEHASPCREKAWVDAESVEVFIDVLRPAPTLIMIGGVHISVALGAMARALGYRTVVIDPRKSFATTERFPAIDQLIQSWPEEGLETVGIDASTAIAVLTHDPKIDDPAIKLALRSPAFYVGALGSRTTHARRVERLLQDGLNVELLARLRAPIGLDLGGRTPEEIALSIMAEITATRHGGLASGT
ncbi:MAG: XdhC/CoxI family protein [Anaerolineales bacterium]|nr:MAG: XdhC/CoxI family protein [Anaerolineales bacterium]